MAYSTSVSTLGVTLSHRSDLARTLSLAFQEYSKSFRPYKLQKAFWEECACVMKGADNVAELKEEYERGERIQRTRRASLRELAEYLDDHDIDIGWKHKKRFVGGSSDRERSVGKNNSSILFEVGILE